MKNEKSIEDVIVLVENLAISMKNGFDSIEKRFATKDDLKQFATKVDLKDFATKEDLKNFATKEDFDNLRVVMEVDKKEILGAFEDAHITTMRVYENLEKRVLVLEDKVL